jgi:hypothetical protein
MDNPFWTVKFQFVELLNDRPVSCQHRCPAEADAASRYCISREKANRQSPQALPVLQL